MSSNIRQICTNGAFPAGAPIPSPATRKLTTILDKGSIRHDEALALFANLEWRIEDLAKEYRERRDEYLASLKDEDVDGSTLLHIHDAMDERLDEIWKTA